MARPPRIEFEDAIYHIMARGNERRRLSAGIVAELLRKVASGQKGLLVKCQM